MLLFSLWDMMRHAEMETFLMFSLLADVERRRWAMVSHNPCPNLARLSLVILQGDFFFFVYCLISFHNKLLLGKSEFKADADVLIHVGASVDDDLVLHPDTDIRFGYGGRHHGCGAHDEPPVFNRYFGRAKESRVRFCVASAQLAVFSMNEMGGRAFTLHRLAAASKLQCAA
jgi:hypothetical protein